MKIHMFPHIFIRTTEARHKTAVQFLWNILLSQDYIYKATYEGWYSITDECFYKPSQVTDAPTDSIKPDETGKFSIETGSSVEWTSEENYCFRLSKFQEQLKAHYEKYTEAIVPNTYYLDVLKAVSEPLEDISVSRPRSRLSWGIEVPGDPEQTIYVWFDALINYLTVTGYPWKDVGLEGSTTINSTAWPADIHVIGKDIVR
jgi:methionyl-tRNA synthetase